MTRADALPTPESVEESEVLAYLQRNPEFFLRHAELLEQMPVRHGSGAAVSLIERQVRVLRDKNAQLGERLDGLLRTARDNEARVKGMNRLAADLIKADSLASVVAGLSASLRQEFDVEAVCLGLFVAGEELLEAGCLPLDKDDLPQQLKDFFRQGRVVCDVIDADLRELLFRAHPELGSVALVPLDRSDCLGVLALASTDRERFRPEMGHLFLEMTASLCAAALRFHGAGEH